MPSVPAMAVWVSPRRYCYKLDYVFAPTGGVLRMVHYAVPRDFEVLIDGTNVNPVLWMRAVGLPT